MLATLTASVTFIAGLAVGQDGRPGPSVAETLGAGAAVAASNGDAPRPGANWKDTRRDVPEEKVKLGFKGEPIGEEIFTFIAESTGKVVMPVNLPAMRNKTVTLLNDAWIDRSEALDLLLQAFRLNRVGVIEKDDVIIVGPIEEMMVMRQMPILKARDDVMSREDKGSLVLKLFQLVEARAEDIGKQLGDGLPGDATLTVDANSNQIVLIGDIALCQHVQVLINELDHTYIRPVTVTFRLAHADATQVSENILDLFDSDAPAPAPGQRPAGGGSPIGTEIELRVTVSVQQNSVTVTGAPDILDELRV